MKKKVVYTIGTRPEIIRSAFIIKLFEKYPEFNFKLLHTGQHYDYGLNDVFFNQLKIPSPDINLKIGSKNHISQITDIMLKSEDFLKKFKPHIVCVFGDTNSSLGVALSSVKLGIPLCHVEAGIREWELDLPEEINRRLIDHCSSLLFALSQNSVNNLINEKIQGKIFNTGDPQFAVFDFYKEQIPQTNILNKLNLLNKNYVLLTIHRNKNVDNPHTLELILDQLSKNLPIVFPIHPRTLKTLKAHNLRYKEKFPNILFIEPLDYLSLIQVLVNSLFIITDSGGLQKEAFWSKKPCITIRKHTGWIETVDYGVNFLADINKNGLTKRINFVIKNIDSINQRFRRINNPYYKKDSAENIVKTIKNFLKD